MPDGVDPKEKAKGGAKGGAKGKKKAPAKKPKKKKADVSKCSVNKCHFHFVQVITVP
jgi:hypothetical protein